MRRKRVSTGQIALCAMLAALAVALLYLSSALPSGRWGVVAAAGLLPAAAVVSAGLLAGGMTWASAALLALFLVPDKGNVLLFILFFGSYPLVKCLIERMKNLPLEILCKFAVFNGILTLFLFVLRAFFPPELLQYAEWLLYAAGNALFIVYDFGLSKLIALYTQRIDKTMRRGRH